VLAGRLPFDEAMLTGDGHGPAVSAAKDVAAGDEVTVDTQALDAFRARAAAGAAPKGDA
jgi:aerobic C4-dicarboxylate transport protein